MKSALQMAQARLDRTSAGLRPFDGQRDVDRALRRLPILGADGARGKILKVKRGLPQDRFGRFIEG